MGLAARTIMLSEAPLPQSAAVSETVDPLRRAPMPLLLAVNDSPFTVHVTRSLSPLGEVGLPPHATVARTIIAIMCFILSRNPALRS